MTNFLVEKFVKNHEEIENNKVRESYGVFSGAVGIVCNVILCLAKFFAGILTSSISITADAFNNLFDAGSSVVSIIGFKMAGKPADKDHPFGHGRIEYVAGLLVSIIILLVGIELLQSSFDKIINPSDMTFSIVSIIIMVVSVLVKLWLSVFNKKLGKKLNSGVMLATAIDSRNDAIATTLVVISVIVNSFTEVNIDGYVGILVALFILWSGFTALKDTLNPLLGQPADAKMVKAIEEKVLSYEGVIGLHDLIVHNYGPGMCIISLHAEVPEDSEFIKIHDTIDTIERDVKAQFNGEVIIHMDPVSTNDKQRKETLKLVKTLVQLVDNNISVHDFRMVECENHTNLIFDIVVPYNFRLSDEAVVADIQKALKSFDEKYELIVHVDKPFV